jgi:hypothetical protein
MQRTGRHVVRGAVVSVLTALLLALTGSAYGATAAPASHTGHRTSTVRTTHDAVPATIPHAHRAHHLQRLDGPGPALLSHDLRPSPSANRTTRPAGSHDELCDRTRATAHGRAPPA